MSSSNPPEIDAAWESAPVALPPPLPLPLPPPPVPARPAAILRGNARGLEIVIDATATTDAIAEALAARLAEAPAFFRGSNVRVRVEDGPLVSGALARLDEIATRFDLRIVEVGAAKKPASSPEPGGDAVPEPDLAAGSAPSVISPEISPDVSPEPATSAAPDPLPAIAPVASDPAPFPTDLITPDLPPLPALPPLLDDMLEEAAAATPGDTRMVVGPVRSGVILEHTGHLVVLGDVNPGAEVLAAGNIIVLGRLRGIAHAGIGRDAGFIVALRLEPQQLRVGRLVARAGDTDAASAGIEIAHVTDNRIVVERYTGKLPPGLATGI